MNSGKEAANQIVIPALDDKPLASFQGESAMLYFSTTMRRIAENEPASMRTK